MSDYKDKVTPGLVTAMPADPTYHDVVRVFADDAPEGAQALAAFPQTRSSAAEMLTGRTNETTEAASNAALFVDAKNVLHETGLTPRDLVAQRGRLLVALRPFLPAYTAYVETMRSHVNDGKTEAERRFSEGECMDSASEEAFEELAKVTFDQLAAVASAIAACETKDN